MDIGTDMNGLSTSVTIRVRRRHYSSSGKIPPTPGLVDQYFNDSTGEDNFGGLDARGPWNEGDGWQYVEAPAFHDLRE
jgi:hypothetical protein